jgi:hypothetical protein
MGRTISRYARYAVTAIWVIAGGWLAVATAGEVRAAWLVVPTPPEVIRDVVIRNVADDNGRLASFRILLFSDEFRWRINSFDVLEQAGKLLGVFGQGLEPTGECFQATRIERCHVTL